MKSKEEMDAAVEERRKTSENQRKTQRATIKEIQSFGAKVAADRERSDLSQEKAALNLNKEQRIINMVRRNRVVEELMTNMLEKEEEEERLRRVNIPGIEPMDVEERPKQKRE